MPPIRNFRFLLIVLFLLSSMASAAAQTTMIPVSIPVNGQFVFSGRLATASGPELSQLFVVDTAIGATHLQDENPKEVFSLTLNHAGTKLAYRSGPTPTILDVTTGTKTSLSLPIGYHPHDWSPDDTHILFVHNNFDTQPERNALKLYNVSSGSLTTLLDYAVGETLATELPPSVPSGLNALTFASISQAQWNPVYPEWILVQLDTRAMPDPEGHPIININFLFNSQTYQMLSLDAVVTEPIQPFPIRWSPDGQYLVVRTLGDDGKGYINLIAFENVSGSWQVNLLDSAQEDGTVKNWLGAGDLLLASKGTVGIDNVYSIVQIIDSTWHDTEFFRLPYSTFAWNGSSVDWRITANEADKQTLTCLFDQALATRLETGMRARVNFTDGTPLRLREAPLVYSSEILQMPEGTEFDILSGPVCANGYRWWQVKLDDSTAGWAAEANSKGYFIEPLL
ncbi:MAG: SH3 domain-containing protein [Anaerolineae bacterium]|nr:SH3 domain-containing protein [Anaerolineae bacterium]